MLTATSKHDWLIEVFALDCDLVQLVWKASPPGKLSIEVASQHFDLSATPPALLGRPNGSHRVLHPRPGGGPGSLVVEGLQPATCYKVTAQVGDRRPWTAANFTTLTPPPGRELSRFATISDLHIGEWRFGALGWLRDVLGWGGAEPYPERCTRAALEEASTWGASLVVAKGDLTSHSMPSQFRTVGKLLAASNVPVLAMLGNHDNRHGVDGRSILAEEGVEVHWQPSAHDLAGIRVIAGYSPHPNPARRSGRVNAAQRDAIADLASEAPAVWLGLHHPLQRWTVPVSYPPGIPGPEANLLIDKLAAANPAAMISCGHTHRNRRRQRGPVIITEVGSTKDYPGVWAGYRVFEGGIIQVIRRTADPQVLPWTETTGRAINGVWGWWSPGTLNQRCFASTWER